MIDKHIDDVTFTLMEDADLQFVSDHGRVFRVFDQQDSGNIAFGVDDGQRRRFVKVAGVHTMTTADFNTPDRSVAMLRSATRVYEELPHEHIVSLLEHRPHGPLYVAVFDWIDGESLYRRNAPRDGEAMNAHDRFRNLLLDQRIHAMDALVSVYLHASDAGYVLLDMYDGSLMYDFPTNRLTVCDIDVSARLPQTNTMGQMFGSSRFMAPEESVLGAAIDERTNVFNLGRFLQMAFGGAEAEGGDPPDQAEPGDMTRAIRAVADRATHADPEYRYQSIRGMNSAWKRVTRS